MLLLLWKWCIMSLWCRKNCAIRWEEQSFTVGRNQVFWRISQGWSSTTAGKLRDEIRNGIISIFFLTLQVFPCTENEEFCSQTVIIWWYDHHVFSEAVSSSKWSQHWRNQGVHTTVSYLWGFIGPVSKARF